MLQSSGRTRGVTMLRVCGRKGRKRDVAQMVALSRGPVMLKPSLTLYLYPPSLALQCLFQDLFLILVRSVTCWLLQALCDTVTMPRSQGQHAHAHTDSDTSFQHLPIIWAKVLILASAVLKGGLARGS